LQKKKIGTKTQKQNVSKNADKHSKQKNKRFIGNRKTTEKH
jgi:hypothetical protein